MQVRQTLRTIVAPLAGSALMLTLSTAQAHTGTGLHLHDGRLLDSALAGALHPLTGLDHLTAMVAVGMWSVLGAPQTRASRWTLPIVFALALGLGAVLGLTGRMLPGVEPMIAASLLVLGLLVASRAALSRAVGTALISVFALFHGLAHGQELSGQPWVTLGGMLLSTLALHGAGMALGTRLQDRSHPGQRWTARLAGGSVAAFGLSLMVPAWTAAL